MECEGERTCLRIPIKISGTTALAWEIFSGPGCDQWTEAGRYDYTLAIKLFECFGLEPPYIIEGVDRLSKIVREVKMWGDLERERKEASDEFTKSAKEALNKL
jgi:hypothetical protein